jgi:integral membrane sensor domain MASE1
MSFELSLIVGSAFGVLAGAMAFLITFDEYRKHQMARRRLWEESLKAGAFSFVVFLLLSVAAGAWLKGSGA